VQGLNCFGASSLSTIVELVGAGFGITLLPEISLGLETRARELTLMRFEAPEPARRIGLVWRATSPRKADFVELGRLVTRAAAEGPLAFATSLTAAKPLTSAMS
jgi:LysR family hydrogen peroxide-inducible transcriptional activator